MTSPITSLDALRNSSAAQPEGPVDPKALKAAKDFEAIFLRTLLSSLEKTTSINGGAAKPTTGQSTYGSMVVGALADNISGSGGIGLADIVAKSLSAHMNVAAPGSKPPK
jgi:Rod binding domain-containing protein